MARPIRVQFEGAYYHLTARGNERKSIFYSDRDRQLFLDTLEQMLRQYGVILHCYCLMPNHYHLVVQTPRANLSQAMAWFQSTYTNRYNRRHKRSGHLFQGRYKAHLVDADEYACQLIRYIHLNPVRGRKDRTIAPEKKEHLEQYRWSSHPYYSGKKAFPEWLNSDWLSYWARTRRKAHKYYRKDILAMFDKSISSPWNQIRGGLVLGTEPLWEKVQQLVEGKKGKHEVKWKEYQGRKALQKYIKVLLEKENDPKVQMWIRIRLGGERIADLAQEQGYRHRTGVFRVVQRLERSAEKNPDLRNKLSDLRRDLSTVTR